MKRTIAFLIFVLFCTLICSSGGSASDEWICPKCYNSASGNFCYNCGSPRPSIQDTSNPAIDAENPGEAILGLWYATHVYIRGTAVDMSNYEMKMTMLLNPDDSFVLCITGYPDAKGTWKFDSDSLTLIDSDSLEYKGVLSEGKLTMDLGKYDYIFERELTESPPLPSPITANSESDFYGTWVTSRFVSEGVTFTPVQLAAMGKDADLTLVISQGKATADIVAKGKMDFNEFNVSFSNGRLLLKSIHNNVVMSLVLTDSGELYTTLENNGYKNQIYLIKK